MSTENINWENGPIDDGEQSSLIMMGYDEEKALKSITSNLTEKTQPEPDDNTPDPASDSNDRGGGIIKRANEYHSTLGPVALEAIGLHGPELSKAIEKRQKEMYRNKFPRLTSAFEYKCEECEAEFDEELDECQACGSTELREPSEKQKYRAKEFFKEVNKEGQSLRELYRYCEGDHSRLAVGLHIVKKKYKYSAEDITLRDKRIVDGGQIISEQVMELVRGDPKRIKPVVDDNGRIGGYWWTCPIHREKGLSTKQGSCEVCGCNLREVYYAEVENVGSQKPSKYYFEDEVIDWSFFNSRLNGLDGLSPVTHLWLEQAILQWMDHYAAGFYDSDNKSYPGKMLIVHTTNKDAFEKTLTEAKADKEDSPYAQGIIYNEYGMESQSAPEAQVIDMMSEEILGQSENLKKDYTNNIRTRYGIADVFDSELDDAGGLNNEGLQLEVTDRDIASAQQDMMEGPLAKLMRVLGFTDWKLKFLPPEREQEEMNVKEKAQTIRILKQANADFNITDDGDIEIIGEGGELPDTEANKRQSVEEGNQSPDEEEVSEGLETLQKGFKHIAWKDDPHLETKQSDPYFNKDEDVPEFVLDAIERASQSALSPTYDELKRSQVDDVHEFFKEKLKQPQGWSQTSLVNDFSEKFDVESGYARTVVIDQVTNLFNKAREIGYKAAEKAGVFTEEDSTFHWVGPDDDATTDCCNWLKDQTEDGVTLQELKDLLQQARRKFFPEHPEREWIPHYGCRHTFVEKQG